MPAATSLLDLPSPCLVSIMQHCSSDARDLCSAARAHSSLRSAAAAAHASITLKINKAGQLWSLLGFLRAHGQHVRHLDLCSASFASIGPATVSLPPSVQQLESLHLRDVRVAVSLERRRRNTVGVLTGRSRLKSLSLQGCSIDTGLSGLAAALRQLPALQHLEIAGPLRQSLRARDTVDILPFPGEVLPGLALTSLELTWEALSDAPPSDLHVISTLTALQDLHFYPGPDQVPDDPFDSDDEDSTVFTASILEPLSRLTSLRLDCRGADRNAEFEPQALRGKPNMQHLQLPYVWFAVGGKLQHDSLVLAELQQLQELTHLNMEGTLKCDHPGEAPTPAAVCAALTASTKLQHLNMADNNFPAGLWQQLFNPSRHLLHLRVLDIGRINIKFEFDVRYGLPIPPDLPLTAADAKRLASCCPGLQHLSAYGTLRDMEAVAALSPLSNLRTLLLGGSGVPWAKLHSNSGVGCAEALAQLTSLIELDFIVEGLVRGTSLEHDLLQLTQLQGLTRLKVWDDLRQSLEFEGKAPGDKPVWQQLEQHCYAAAAAAASGAAAAAPAVFSVVETWTFSDSSEAGSSDDG